ncbi:hypothetical protein B566_EDAN004719 [Ephemera danica]|nr:hypothetical protein B566_EDAN004719 [Ephemera danica]
MFEVALKSARRMLCMHDTSVCLIAADYVGGGKKTRGCRVTWVDEQLASLFYKLGRQVALRPGYFLLIPPLIAALCATGFQRIEYEIDPEYLFSPVNGHGKMERRIVEHFFPPNDTSRFNVGRITRQGRFGRVIVVAQDGGNMLRTDIWREMRILDGIIQNATAYLDSEYFTYRQICARWVDECFRNDVLELDHVLPEVENGTLRLTFPVMFNPVTWDTHIFPVYFGNTVIDEDGTIVTVPAVQLVYFAAADTKRQDAKGGAWEEAFLNAVGQAEDSGMFEHISTARFASRTLELELENNTRTVVPYFSTAFIIMVVFSMSACMMTDWVRSKPLLGLIGTLSAIAGTLAAFGFVIYCGVKFIGINLAAPFLLIGIGIDDTFVMLAAWRRTSVTLPVPERMGRMLAEAAVSITITSVTDVLSFWIGLTSTFPSVQIFCLYTGTAVLFTFLWHVTFFAACVALSGYAEQRNLHSVSGMKVLPVSEAGISESDPYNPRDNREHACMAFFRDWVARALNVGVVKALVLIIFAAYLAGACYGITTLKEGLERRRLSKEDSYSIVFYDLEDEYYREFPYRIQNTSYITSPLYSESWLRSFVSYVDRNQDYLNSSIDTEQDFIDTLKELYLSSPNPFSLDIKFNDNGEHIIASRFLIQAVNITDALHEQAMVTDLRRICKESPLNATVFHPYFVFFDQFELVRPTSLQCMVLAAVVMMIVSLLFIPNVLCCFWVAFSVISIETGVVGYMALWDVSLDSISMIQLIMCIGFSVDFTAHICYAYMSSKAKKPSERVKECLYALGLPIVQGALSTILGVAVLYFAGSYIFLTFFKTAFLVIFFGAMHGILLLPVLLSLFGPGSCCPSHEIDTTEENIDEIKSKKAKQNEIKMTSGQANAQTTAPQNYGVPRSPSKGDAQNLTVLHPHLALPFGAHSGGKWGSTVPLDKDLGLGTSAEEESSQSSGKSGQSSNKVEPRCFQPPHLMEVYNNCGYVSDDERRGAPTWTRHLSARYPGEGSAQQFHHHHHRPRHYASQFVNRPAYRNNKFP